jgi:hypothetical protein
MSKLEFVTKYPEVLVSEFKFGKLYDETKKAINPTMYHRPTKKWYR